MVAGRDPEILDGVGVVENEQFRSGSTLEVRRTDFPCGFGVFAVEDVLSAFVTEGQDHISMIARITCYINLALFTIDIPHYLNGFS